MINFVVKIGLFLIFVKNSLCFIELPLIRKQQLQGTVDVSGLSSSQFVSNNDSTATGICFLTLDLKNCSTQDNLGTVIGLGTPPQLFNVQLQFFTDFLWVYDWSCKLTGCGSELPKSLFDRSLSKTFTNTNTQFAIRHQNFKLTGTQVVDIGTFGNSTWPVNFGLVQRAPLAINTEYDGVIGTGLPQSKQSFLSVLLANETQQIVSVFVRNTLKSRGQDDGRLTIGKLNDKHCAKTWKWAHLASKRNWKAVAKNILLGNTTILGSNHEVRINPGSLITFAPRWVAADLYERLGAQKYPSGNLYVVKNSDLKKFPNIRFNFDGATIELSPEHYTTRLPSLSNDLRVVTIYGFYETPSWQLGDNFFRSYCCALDLKTNQIGFSKQLKNPPKDRIMIKNSSNNMQINFWLILFVTIKMKF